MNNPLITDAQYADTGVKRYIGNPLIEALPPIWSPEKIEQLLEWQPEIPTSDDRKKPAHIRVHEVPAVRQLIYLLPEYSLYQSIISVLIRDGYTTRNPMLVRTWQYLHMINSAGQNDLKPIEPLDHRASGILLSGLSGIGKSTFIHRLFANYPHAVQHTKYGEKSFRHLQIVWIKINCPHDGSLRGLVQQFFVQVDRIAGTNFTKEYFLKTYSPTLPTLLGLMRRVAADYFIGTLIIDELQNLNRAKTQGDQGMLEFLGSMVEDIGVPVIGIGTPAVTRLFANELRIARRSASLGYYEFHRPGPEDPAWIDFMDTLWQYDWTETSSILTPKLRHRFYEHSQGVTALVVALFILAQYRCLLEGETLDENLLDEISQCELAPVQAALRALRSKNEDIQKTFNDLLPSSAWLEGVLDVSAALHRSVNQKTSALETKSRASTKLSGARKGLSVASNDPKDLRNLPKDAKSAHAKLREQGLTPTNPFKFAESR
jgi:hypothetical protein